MTYEYRQAVFEIKEKEHYFRLEGPFARNHTVTDILEYGETVEIPDMIEGDPVTGLKLPPDREYRGVKKLILSAHLGAYNGIYGVTFPDLKEVVVSPDNKVFSTDGNLLFRERGEELCAVLVIRDAQDKNKTTRLEIPESVRCIGRDALQNVNCSEIIYNGPEIEADEDSFRGCPWYDRQDRAVCLGDSLCLIKPSDKDAGLSVYIPDHIRYVSSRAFAKTDRCRLSIPADPLLIRKISAAYHSSEKMISVRIRGELRDAAAEQGLSDVLQDKWTVYITAYDSDGLYLVKPSLWKKSDASDPCFFDNLQRCIEDISYFGDRKLADAAEQSIIRVVRRSFLNKEQLDVLMDICRKRGMTSACAYILRQQALSHKKYEKVKL